VLLGEAPPYDAVRVTAVETETIAGVIEKVT